FFFFFSSRRRHTRFSRDWSSDVCSSDLTVKRSELVWVGKRLDRTTELLSGDKVQILNVVGILSRSFSTRRSLSNGRQTVPSNSKIGRASCRESAPTSQIGVLLNKKNRLN